MRAELESGSLPSFFDKDLEALANEQGAGNAEVLKQAYTEFLRAYEDEIKQVGMTKKRTIGVRLGEQDLLLRDKITELKELGVLRKSQAFRFALIWWLGVKHGQKNK